MFWIYELILLKMECIVVMWDVGLCMGRGKGVWELMEGCML